MFICILAVQLIKRNPPITVHQHSTIIHAAICGISVSYYCIIVMLLFVTFVFVLLCVYTFQVSLDPLFLHFCSCCISIVLHHSPSFALLLVSCVHVFCIIKSWSYISLFVCLFYDLLPFLLCECVCHWRPCTLLQIVMNFVWIDNGFEDGNEKYYYNNNVVNKNNFTMILIYNYLIRRNSWCTCICMQ